MALSCIVYGSKLLSCCLPTKVAGELPQCLFQATSCVKDQRHRNFVTSHPAKLPSRVYFITAVTRGRAYVLVFVITECSRGRIHYRVHKRLFRRLLRLLFIRRAMIRVQTAAVSAIPSFRSRSIHDFRKVGLKQLHLAL